MTLLYIGPGVVGDFGNGLWLESLAFAGLALVALSLCLLPFAWILLRGFDLACDVLLAGGLRRLVQAGLTCRRISGARRGVY